MSKRLLILEPSGQRVLVEDRTSFIDAIRESGLHIPSECGGSGTCGKCMIKIIPSPSPTVVDLKHLSEVEVQDGVRLACEHIVQDKSRAVLLDKITEAKILSEGESRVVDIVIDSGVEGELGVAIDIGTTTVVAYLMDLEHGSQISSASTLNPQIAYGEDVVTRLTFTFESDANHQTLHDLILQKIEELIHQLVENTGFNYSQIVRISVVGNTVMHHLFLDLDTSTLSVAPYTPVLTKGVTTHTIDLGLKKLNAEIYCAPIVAGFVGSDITALILSQRLHETEEIILAIDIGTNGEIVLSNRGEVCACSTAAGSAFEGATISQGMRGQDGAIEHVQILHQDEPPDITTIGHIPPQGICGSGIVDIVSELRRLDLISPEGLLLESKRTFKADSGGLGYIVVERGEHEVKRRIAFTQKDIRQVQLAKAAIFTGTQILMKTTDLAVDVIDKFLLAGAFGNYIDPDAALTIGLLPPVSLDKVLQVGNTAGVGAKMMLVSSAMRQTAENLARLVNYVELAEHPDFQNIFIKATRFV